MSLYITLFTLTRKKTVIVLNDDGFLFRIVHREWFFKLLSVPLFFMFAITGELQEIDKSANG
jgi:hypothetical protein